MAIVEFEEGTLRIDAAVIGQGLNVEPSLVQILMREGKITALCERGVLRSCDGMRCAGKSSCSTKSSSQAAKLKNPSSGPLSDLLT